MGNVAFGFVGRASRNAYIAAEAVARIFDRNGESIVTPEVCDEAAEDLGRGWTAKNVELLLKNCEFYPDAVADQNEMFRLVHALEAENLALRSDLKALQKRIEQRTPDFGDVEALQKQLNGVLARVKVLEGTLADNAKA